MIDFLNHLSIWFVNSVNFGPSSNYPYGLEKIKNILSHTVAMLFASSGIYNLHESYVLFLAGNEILTHEGSLTTTIVLHHLRSSISWESQSSVQSSISTSRPHRR